MSAQSGPTKEELDFLYKKIQDTEDNINILHAKIRFVEKSKAKKRDISTIKSDIAHLQNDISSQKLQTKKLSEEYALVQKEIESIKLRISETDSKLGATKNKTKSQEASLSSMQSILIKLREVTSTFAPSDGIDLSFATQTPIYPHFTTHNDSKNQQFLHFAESSGDYRRVNNNEDKTTSFKYNLENLYEIISIIPDFYVKFREFCKHYNIVNFNKITLFFYVVIISFYMRLINY